jgi:hypothetical protein
MAKEKRTTTQQETRQPDLATSEKPYLEAGAWILGILLTAFLLRRYHRSIGRGATILNIIAAFVFFGALAFASLVFLFDIATGLPSRLVGYAIGWNFYGAVGQVAFISFLFLMAWGGAQKVLGWFAPTEPMTSRQRIRGRELISFERIKELAIGYSGPYWGYVALPEGSATQHFAAIGSTGSGKTMLLRLLMQSVIPRIKEGSDSRALIYDAKADILPLLDGMGVAAPVWILNPFDERSSAWEMGVDVTAPATAQQIATILIAPSKNESQPFFTDAARALLTGVMISFMKRSPGKWLLSDVIHATRTTQSFAQVLSATEETKYLVEQYLGEGITANNILSSLATKLQPFEFIAAAWDRAESRISLKSWLASDSILVLGNDEAVRSALDSINRVIFRRIVELTLAESESATRRTWFFLDELRQAGALDGLNNLLTAGRSKGACVVLGAQDVEGLREVYGENRANELLGLCGHKAILRLDSPITAKWASELFGTVEDLETRRSHSSSESKGEGRSNTSSGTQVSEQHVVREVVLPSEFLSLPFPSRKNGMIGYFLSPEFGGAGYRAHISGEWIAGDLKPPGATPAVLQRSEEDQFLGPWSESRRAELGLSASLKPLPAKAIEPSRNLDSVLDEVLAERKRDG